MYVSSLATLTQWVQAGDVITFPTDTVPALATLPHHGQKIFDTKQRAADKPLILLGAAWEDFLPYLAGTAAEREQWRAIAAHHWPGPLTLVLPATDAVPRAMNPQQPGTIGIRIPAQDFALDLLRQTQPLATTSANRSGSPPLTTLAAIHEAFPAVGVPGPELIPTLETLGSGQPSTVAKWIQNDWQILRQGSIVLSH